MINKDIYKRLTERDKNNGKPFIPYKDYRTDKKINGYDDGFFDLLNRLAELEDKIENRTLIELPCKVGDSVYTIEDGIIEEHEVMGILMQFEELFFKILRKRDLVCKFWGGRSVFLTKAEAEARLKELKENNIKVVDG